MRGLDKWKSEAKIPSNSRGSALGCILLGGASGFMTSKPSSQPPKPNQPCQHPRVQIVSRDEDAEFVECLECREIFESSELKDMTIEERVEKETQES
jgi:hypothetical protein